MTSSEQDGSAPPKIIVAEGVTAGYVPGVTILDDVSLHVDRAELVGIFGPNGAGKSTLLKAIFGLADVRAGRIVFEDGDVTGAPSHELVRRGIGFVPQLSNVFTRLSVVDNLRMGAFIHRGEFRRRWDELAHLFPQLTDRMHARAGSLSGGERQMLAMARALMASPRLLCLDEPSAGLSPKAQTEIFRLIDAINDAGTSVLIVEQNARRCLRICDRGYILDQGRNAVAGTGSELLADPQVVELYLGRLGAAVDEEGAVKPAPEP